MVQTLILLFKTCKIFALKSWDYQPGQSAWEGESSAVPDSDPATQLVPATWLWALLQTVPIRYQNMQKVLVKYCSNFRIYKYVITCRIQETQVHTAVGCTLLPHADII